MSSQDLEAKIVVLGAQGVGKTSLLNRFVHDNFLPPSAQPPTIGANFLTKRLTSTSDHHSPTVRLQIWDTAGQERFRSISKLYYRGANAAILCYDITDRRSFEDMGIWLRELREYNSGLESSGGAWGDGCVIHIVGTKADLVAEEPTKREVPFESCISYVAEQLHGFSGLNTSFGFHNNEQSSAQAPSIERSTKNSSTINHNGTASPSPTSTLSVSNNATTSTPATSTNRSSGIWTFPSSTASSEDYSNNIWDSCHEISAKDGEGVEEVFRVIVRKLVEQKQRREQRDAQMAALVAAGVTPSLEEFKSCGGYFDKVAGAWKMGDDGMGHGRGSFRLTKDSKRKSWLLGGLTGAGGMAGSGIGVSIAEAAALADAGAKKSGRCC